MVSGGVVMGRCCLVGSDGFVDQTSVLGDRVKVDALGYAQGTIVGGGLVANSFVLSFGALPLSVETVEHGFDFQLH